MNERDITILRNNIWRRNEEEFDNFIEIIDKIDEIISDNDADVLFETFLSIDDFGSLEHVLSKLIAAGDEVFFGALSRNLVSVIERAPEHGQDLITSNYLYKPQETFRAINSNSRENIKKISEFIREIVPIEPQISDLLEKIEAA